MTHLVFTDGRKNSMTKGQDVSVPTTIIECPPVRVAGVRFYKTSYDGRQVMTDIFSKFDKELSKRLSAPKKDSKPLDSVKPEDCTDVTLFIQTQPKFTGIGKKRPEIFEVAVAGSVQDKLAFAKEHLGKELSVKDVFKEGQFIDMHAVTKGKGFQGPVKRFGVKIRFHKSEKTKRGPGSLGGWSGQQHVMYRVAHAGQMGFHNRVDYNKQIMMIGDDPKKVNPKGGFVRYGEVKSQYLLVKGSIPGPKKRLIRMKVALRPDTRKEETAQTIQYISTESKQGR